MANYITTLRDENAALKAEIASMKQVIVDFRAHLISPKFHDDPTIQVRDVDSRLVQILMVGE